MCIKPPIIIFLLHIAILLTSITLSLADDTEIYVGNGATDSNGVQPNVLFMLDTSGSMTGMVDGISRLDHMKEALRIIINQSNNVNMGLMRFHKEGGPVLYPVRNINEAAEEVGDSESDLVIQISNSTDDAEEHLISGTVELNSTELEMTKILVGSSTINLSIPVSHGEDDAEEHENGSMESLSSTDLELMKESDIQKVGIRFRHVTIPAGATITSASIEFQLDERKSSTDKTLEVKILGHKVTNSSAFSSSSHQISNRITNNPTTASVLWNPPTGLSVGDTFEANNLASIAQEIIDQSGWSSGKPMTFLLTLSDALGGGKRIAESKNGTQAPILNISYTTGGLSDEQKIGLRFQEVMIPKGATITNAVIEFEAATTQSETTSLTINGEDADDSSAFDDDVNDISGRTLTAASVSWNNISAWTSGERYQTPQLKTIIQEQVNRSGWCGGQSLSFIISGLANSLRKAESYDGNPTSAPILRVSYDPDSVPATTCLHQVIQASIATGNDDIEESSSGSISYGSSDLELVKDDNNQKIGLRFTNVAIPKDTTIINAELIFSNDTSEPESGTVNLTIKGEDVDNSAPFTSNDVSSRTTTGNISWSPSAWGSTSELYSSADISTIVQSIVNRAGWEQGNAMTFVITGTDSAKRVANSFEGDASLAPRLRIVVSGGVDIPVQTVRDKLIETVDNLNYKGGTPILDVLYEAALYYRGEEVLYGRTRGFGSEIGDGSLGDGSSSRSQYTRVSNPLSWTGGGTTIQPAGCTDDNPNSTNCIGEHIEGTATYISPIAESCQANYQILLSDGSGYGTNSVDLVNAKTTDTSTCSGHDDCAEVLAGFMHTNDQSTAHDEAQTVATYTIGFNLENTDPGFLQDIATAGGGSFHTASTAADLANVFQTIISEVLSHTSSFSAPTVSVNTFNKLFHDEDVFFSTFLPSNRGRWAGNLKKYKVCKAGNEACKAGDILDKNELKATYISGQFLESSTSFWSTGIDGREVQTGGAGSNISYPRKIFVENGTSFVQLTEAKGDVGDAAYDVSLRNVLDDSSLSDSGYLNLVKWILGKDVLDEDEDDDSTDVRWAFSDALHSQPLVITYGIDLGTDTESKSDDTSIKKIFIGTNDGALRMINAETGEEEWAFIPTFMANQQNQLMVNANGAHISGVDGNIRSWIIDNDDDGIIEPTSGDKIYLYFSMRRGGRHIYAIDVTPSSTLTTLDSTTGITPSLLWKIEGGATTGFEELGQTWSTPQVDYIWYDSVKTMAVFFGGGYHPEQDSTYGPSAYGNALFVVDALTGNLLWRAGQTGTLDTDNGIEFDNMKYPIPSDLALLDTNADNTVNRLYVGDTGGQVWRIDFKNKSGGVDGTGTILADISGKNTFGNVTMENQRKFFYPPDVAFVNDYNFSANATYDLLIMVSGNRSSPNDKTVYDRVYMFRDYTTTGLIAEDFTSLTEDNLYDATENWIQDLDGTSISDDAMEKVAILKEKDGWFVSLVEGTTVWVGEKGLSEPAILDGKVILTTYLPAGEADPDEVCSTPVEGTGRIYGINIYNGAAVYPEWSGSGETYVRSDRVYNQTLTGIPSSPVIRMDEDGSQILVGGGGGITPLDPDVQLPIIRSYWKEL